MVVLLEAERNGVSKDTGDTDDPEHMGCCDSAPVLDPWSLLTGRARLARPCDHWASGRIS